MKLAKWGIFVFFACFAAVNGFCGGKSDSGNTAKIIDAVSQNYEAVTATLETNKKEARDNNRKTNDLLEEILYKLPDSTNRDSDNKPPEPPEGPSLRETNNRADNSISIAGAGRLKSHNADAIAGYVSLYNRAASPGWTRTLINTYFSEAENEGINPDLAIAQMLYATDFLKSSQRVSSHNYAGFNTHTRNWNGRFPNMTQGVKAHIQHLKGYTSTCLDSPGTRIVDPRWAYIENIRGTKHTLHELAPIWLPKSSSDYESHIVRIINNLHKAQTL